MSLTEVDAGEGAGRFCSSPNLPMIRRTRAFSVVMAV